VGLFQLLVEGLPQLDLHAEAGQVLPDFQGGLAGLALHFLLAIDYFRLLDPYFN
jgi:hypothetical protein